MPIRQLWLLRTRSERPRSYAADQGDEITPFHSTGLHPILSSTNEPARNHPGQPPRRCSAFDPASCFLGFLAPSMQ
jgi:hypothetical protein